MITPDELRRSARRQRIQVLVLQVVIVLNLVVMTKVGNWWLVALFVALMGVAICLQIAIGHLFDQADEIERLRQS